MIDSFVFTFELITRGQAVDYRLWGFAGWVLGSDCPVSRVNLAYTRSMWDKHIPPDGLLGWNLTGLYLACMASTTPIYFARCKVCKEAFEALGLNALAMGAGGRPTYGETANVLCKLCA